MHERVGDPDGVGRWTVDTKKSASKDNEEELWMVNGQTSCRTDTSRC